MAVIQNQQTDLVKYISLNGTELTVGGMTYSLSEELNVSDIDTSSGRIKRFYRKNKKAISLSYSYIASNSDKTVDGRVGRDFIYNLAASSPYVLVNYKDESLGEDVQFYGFIDNYTDSIIRRDLQNQCIYYEVNFEIREA